MYGMFGVARQSLAYGMCGRPWCYTLQPQRGSVVNLKILPVPGKVASTFSIFRDPAPGAPPNSTEYLCSDDGGVGELHRLFVL